MCTESAVQQFLVGVVTKQKAAARVEYQQEALNLIMDMISLIGNKFLPRPNMTEYERLNFFRYCICNTQANIM